MAFTTISVSDAVGCVEWLYVEEERDEAGERVWLADRLWPTAVLGVSQVDVCDPTLMYKLVM